MHEKAKFVVLFICNRKKSEIQICSNQHEICLVQLSPNFTQVLTRLLLKRDAPGLFVIESPCVRL